MNTYTKLAMAVSKTSKARNGYVHKPKKKKKEKKVILTRRKGQVISRIEFDV